MQIHKWFHRGGVNCGHGLFLLLQSPRFRQLRKLLNLPASQWLNKFNLFYQTGFRLFWKYRNHTWVLGHRAWAYPGIDGVCFSATKPQLYAPTFSCLSIGITFSTHDCNGCAMYSVQISGLPYFRRESIMDLWSDGVSNCDMWSRQNFLIDSYSDQLDRHSKHPLIMVWDGLTSRPHWNAFWSRSIDLFP